MCIRAASTISFLGLNFTQSPSRVPCPFFWLGFWMVCDSTALCCCLRSSECCGNTTQLLEPPIGKTSVQHGWTPLSNSACCLCGCVEVCGSAHLAWHLAQHSARQLVRLCFPWQCDLAVVRLEDGLSKLAQRIIQKCQMPQLSPSFMVPHAKELGDCMLSRQGTIC